MDSARNLGATLEALFATVESRKGGDPAQSYVASLYVRGLDTILKKVGEETAETLIAAKNGDRAEVVHEMADVLFHLLVLMAQQNIQPGDLAVELDKRMGRSGHEEKAARSNK